MIVILKLGWNIHEMKYLELHFRETNTPQNNGPNNTPIHKKKRKMSPMNDPMDHLGRCAVTKIMYRGCSTILISCLLLL